MLSLITVTYAEADRAQALFASLLAFPPACEWEWIVVDNGSSDEVVSQLKIMAQHPQVRLVPLTENVGFGAANNVGASFATGDILGFINPDITVGEHTWAPLLQSMKDYPSDLIVPCLMSKADELLNNTRADTTLLGHVLHRFGIHTGQKIAWAQGSFYVMGRALWNALGGFDDRFFLFFEDTDLCRRVAQLGRSIHCIKESVAVHGTDRLSGKGISILRPTFWIHCVSFLKYACKWGVRKWPCQPMK